MGHVRVRWIGLEDDAIHLRERGGDTDGLLMVVGEVGQLRAQSGAG